MEDKNEALGISQENVPNENSKSQSASNFEKRQSSSESILNFFAYFTAIAGSLAAIIGGFCEMVEKDSMFALLIVLVCGVACSVFGAALIKVIVHISEDLYEIKRSLKHK